MRKILFFIISTILIVSCEKKSRLKIDVSDIEMKLKIARFEQEFYNANAETLPKLKQKYPLLFPMEHDSVWLNKIKNKDEQELFLETQKLYSNFTEEKKQLENLFKHIKYYQKSFEAPKVITILTNMDSRIVYADTLLFISLDNFLGKNHRFYDGFPKYIRQNNTKEHLMVDVAKEIINKQIPPNSKRRFLDRIIYEGKKMYLLDAYLPELSDKLKIGYSDKKMQWINVNEENVWRYFIDKNYLYSADLKLNKRFIDIAPYSKFYLESDNKSPGQVGIYIGWQIVRSYMKNNNVSLQKLIQTNEDEIFKKSKYKPKK